MTAAATTAARTTVPGVALVAATAAAAGTGLAVSATGSMLVAAILLGVATRDRWSGLAASLAVVAVAVRFGTTDFGDVAGIQSVLGAAGLVGPATAAASAWAAAAAVVLAAAPTISLDPEEAPTDQIDLLDPAVPVGLTRLLVAVAGGSLAAAIVAGPGPGGGLAIRIGAAVGASVLCGAMGLVARTSRSGRARSVLAVVAGIAALALAGWPA